MKTGSDKSKVAAKPRRKGGRPSSYRPEYARQAEKLCELGATDAQLANFFGVTEQTINNWKTDHPEFFESLKGAKIKADAVIEKALFQRANGYSYPDVHVSNYQGEVTLTPITKHYPPDPTSMIFWLKNRQPSRWRDRQELAHSGLDGLVERLKAANARAARDKRENS